MNEQTMKTRFVCPACYKAYDKIEDLINHRQNVHGWKVYGYSSSIEARLSRIEEIVAQFVKQREERDDT